MVNVRRVRDNAEKKIVILRAFKFRTESTEFLDKGASQRGEMADVVKGKKEIGGPVRLEERRVEAILGQFVFVRINQVGLGMLLKQFRGLKERIGFQQIIMIEKTDPFSSRLSESKVRSCANPLVVSKTNEFDALVARR